MTNTLTIEREITTIDVMVVSTAKINALNATIEAQAAELVRLRAELAATQKQLKRVRNNAVAMSQPDAFKVGR